MRVAVMRNKMLKSAVAAALAMTTAIANPSIMAMKVDNVKVEEIGADHKIWDKAKDVNITISPQTTIRFNDKKANVLNADNVGKMVKVSAIYDSSAIAFKVRWADGTQNIQNGMESDEYPDGFAIQLAVESNDTAKLPYIGMGSEERPVLVHLQKAVNSHYKPNGNSDVLLQVNRHQVNAFDENLTEFDQKVSKAGIYDYQKVFISEGFRSMTEIKEGSDKFSMEMEYEVAGWTGIMSRLLKDKNIDFSQAGAIPVAFAVWDGEKLGRGGLKHLSAWIAVKLEGRKGGEDLIKELTAKPIGDAKAGKANVEAMCASCHTLNGEKVATPFTAPDLTNIGGYSTAAYLAESIKDPNAVIVPGYNRTAHKNFAWYTVNERGERTSTMPSMMTDETMINDAVAYLKTLKAKIEK